MEDAREYLLRIPSFAREKHSLSQAEAFLRELDCPLPGVVIHVAGTNGKGSVCAFLSSILRASGLHVGTFTSPHLTDIRERICLDGEMIEEEAFQRCFMQVQAAVEKMERGGFPHPTFFEYLFYMAAAFFRESRPDAVILEAGMGGLRDVTNVCRPALTVLTSVSLDHMAYLGDTVEKIAAEKAGILKPGAPLVFDGNDPAAARVIREGAEQAKVPYFDVREEPLDVSWDGEYPVVTLPFADGRVSARLPFPALYQVWNSALAVRAAELLWEDGRLGGITPGGGGAGADLGPPCRPHGAGAPGGIPGRRPQPGRGPGLRGGGGEDRGEGGPAGPPALFSGVRQGVPPDGGGAGGGPLPGGDHRRQDGERSGAVHRRAGGGLRPGGLPGSGL